MAGPDEVREVFSLFDKGNDTISVRDLGTVLRALGRCPTEQYVEGVARQFPQGFVDFNSFMQILQQPRQPEEGDGEEQIIEAFRVFDKDQQGTIELSELRTVLSSLGEKMGDDEVDELLREAGMLNMQQIDYRQFAKIIMGN